MRLQGEQSLQRRIRAVALVLVAEVPFLPHDRAGLPVEASDQLIGDDIWGMAQRDAARAELLERLRSGQSATDRARPAMRKGLARAARVLECAKRSWGGHHDAGAERVNDRVRVLHCEQESGRGPSDGMIVAGGTALREELSPRTVRIAGGARDRSPEGVGGADDRHDQGENRNEGARRDSHGAIPCQSSMFAKAIDGLWPGMTSPPLSLT